MLLGLFKNIDGCMSDTPKINVAAPVSGTPKIVVYFWRI